MVHFEKSQPAPESLGIEIKEMELIIMKMLLIA